MRHPRKRLRTLPCGLRPRRGLAPLELVLGLPLLMCMLALIVNIGTATKWKLRSLFVARQAAWSQRLDRKGLTDPRPAGWPSGAIYEMLRGGDNLFPNDPFASFTVVRGPVLQGPGVQDAQLQVDTTKLQVAADLIRGHAKIDRPTPMLQDLTGIHYDLQHLLTDSRWRYRDMDYPTNEERRTTKLYKLLPPPDGSAYQAAAERILNSPTRDFLRPLDNDKEFLWWYGAAPDFYPHLAPMCTLDPVELHKGAIDPLVKRIKGPRGDGKGGVPEAMGKAFFGLYLDIVGDEKNGGKKIMKLPPPPEGGGFQGKQDNVAGFPP